MSSTPYAVLGVHPGANDEEIRNAYRLLIKSTHPDGFGGSEAPAHVVGIFRKIQESYELLTDPERRASLDADLEPAPSRQAESCGLGLGLDLLA